jgi:hypothetical protein
MDATPPPIEIAEEFPYRADLREFMHWWESVNFPCNEENTPRGELALKQLFARLETLDPYSRLQVLAWFLKKGSYCHEDHPTT